MGQASFVVRRRRGFAPDAGNNRYTEFGLTFLAVIFKDSEPSVKKKENEKVGPPPKPHQHEKANPADASPCDGCGLCCRHLIVEAYAIDVVREPRIEMECPLPRRNVHLPVLEACWILTGPGGACPFLTKEQRCGIYPTRPNSCVSFMVGGHKCQELRKEHGLPPVVLPASMHAMLAEIMQATIAEETLEFESP